MDVALLSSDLIPAKLDGYGMVDYGERRTQGNGQQLDIIGCMH